MPLDIVSTTEEKVPIIINPTTTAGKPAKIDGLAVIDITSGSATVGTPTQAELDATPGLVGFVVSEDITGVSTYTVTADADLGAGVENIVDGGTYTYSQPNAANLGLTNGVAVPK